MPTIGIRKTKMQSLKTKKSETLKKKKQKKKVGRPKILCDKHKEFLLEKYGEDSKATVDEAVESLISHFVGLKAAKTTVYEFMTKDCALTMKKAHFEPKERKFRKKVLMQDTAERATLVIQI
ncbi:uncharacterized protein B0P05DRAFT_571762 [Gilbertella persicaria]|uniref:uncharacterized protein n=1 Tax=Gilbertella persicaria TaxID=101096 RepID=UPI00221EE2F1|nr:uncharacterized protein B0P05DRAFT_571736 [Gilbertella persicaria]XP_051434899.1 uncharacterized protein B0P05DRAFT_571760 [Gilbertella persicaria]XP_051434902.1 uncharacterized protein B0P05DRAFT_571762 [Gilbertella persicaria]KAI8079072.1 hypothetical protein B0P05DRAFT_571736 [Gilbertella persicaria]KAI8079104.1 hypothetical protein B0P05DRAFT_571760 [Gilbertella persicaria]KAI8079107.1 hypothetical protein B0P05DRAFT_571762 [Gilbertella persicaria]